MMECWSNVDITDLDTRRVKIRLYGNHLRLKNLFDEDLKKSNQNREP